MSHIILIVFLSWLVLDTFSEMIVSGNSFVNAFKTRWLDRILNALFNKNRDRYNTIIDTVGECCSIKKHIFSYLDYDEYVTLTIFKKDKIIELEYSITNDEIKTRTVNLKNLKSQDSYYGRWIMSYCNQLEKSKKFNGNCEEEVQNLINISMEFAKEEQEKSKEMMKKYKISYVPVENREEDKLETKILKRKAQMIEKLERELLS